MKTIAALTAAFALIAAPACAAQKAPTNLPLLQAAPQPTLTAKAKPHHISQPRVRYMEFKLKEVLISQ
jgi:hypothetical protein